MILFRVLWSIFKMAAGIDAEFKMAAVSEADFRFSGKSEQGLKCFGGSSLVLLSLSLSILIFNYYLYLHRFLQLGFIIVKRKHRNLKRLHEINLNQLKQYCATCQLFYQR